MEDYQNIKRNVVILPEAEKEAKKLNLLKKLNKLKDRLSNKLPIKGHKKISPKAANTYEARLDRKFRAYLIYDNNIPTIFKVGDHL